LAFDFGEKRIGVAVGQTVSRTARAVTTVVVKGGRADWTRIAGLVDEWDPDSFVVGMPMTADGAPHPLAAGVARFARQLTGRFKRPVRFVDERLSSYIAKQGLGDSRHGVDALAAQAILETCLEEQPTTIP
jgi:putative Holliday junction resolvase